MLDQIQQQYNTPEDPYFIWQNGLRVYTTLDWDLQAYAECVARSHIGWLNQQDPKPCRNDLATIAPVPEVVKQSVRSRSRQRLGGGDPPAPRAKFW